MARTLPDEERFDARATSRRGRDENTEASRSARYYNRGRYSGDKRYQRSRCLSRNCFWNDAVIPRVLWRRNYRLSLVGIPTLLIAGIHRRSHIIIGLPIDYCGVGIKCARVQHWIDLRVRSTGSAAAIYVVASHALRIRCGPGKINAMLRGRGPCPGQRFNRRRVRSIAGERKAARRRSGCRRREGYRVLDVLARRNDDWI